MKVEKTYFYRGRMNGRQAYMACRIAITELGRSE